MKTVREFEVGDVVRYKSNSGYGPNRIVLETQRRDGRLLLRFGKNFLPVDSEWYELAPDVNDADVADKTDSCKIRWFVYQDNYENSEWVSHTLIPRQSFHKPSGGWHGYEARCETHDWETRTGGAIPACIRREIDDHKWEVKHGIFELRTASVQS